jgi:hypothetical protein
MIRMLRRCNSLLLYPIYPRCSPSWDFDFDAGGLLYPQGGMLAMIAPL